MEIKLLSCPLCLKPHFEGVDALRSSLINVATSHLSCPVCSESLLGLDKLTIHLFSHITHNIIQEKYPSSATTTNVNPNEEKIVEESIRIDELIVNNNQQSEKTDVMNVTVENSEILVETVEKCIRCDICNFCFNDKAILEIHQKLLHETQPNSAKCNNYNYHCHLCSKKFKMRGSLMVHLRVAHYGFGHQNHHCSNTLKLVSDYETDKKISSIVAELDTTIQNENSTSPKQLNCNKIQDNKQWECDVCSKMFTTKYFLKKHKRLHTGEMPYNCIQCNKSFTFQQSYHKHMLYHSSEKPHVCSECGRAFKELSTLHNHERIHSGERPFACETCGKCFRQRVSYLVHRRIHTGVMPYKCTACDKSFRYKVSQRSHKCPVNPPGSVVKTPNLIEKLSMKFQNNEEKGDPNGKNCIEVGVMDNMNVERVDALYPNVSKQQLPNDQPQIICQQENLQIRVSNCFQNFSTPRGENKQNFLVNLNILNSPPSYLQETNSDFLSIVLSPLVPEVQSLCLSSPKSNDESNNKNGPFQTINEESLKELLYGSSK